MIRFLSLAPFRGFEPLFNLDVALRYLPIVDRLVDRPSGWVLEVGSGNRGLAAYYAGRVVGVEPRPTPAKANGLVPVAATGTALPFASGAFDTVVSVDVLEHVPPADRLRFVEELVRVAARRLILVFPEGAAAALHDRTLAQHARRLHEGLDQSLAEHLEHGLPEIDLVRAAIERAAGGRLSVRVARSLNLLVRGWIMRRWMGASLPDLALYRLGVLLIPFRRWLDRGGCYRVVLDVAFRG